MTLGEVGNTDNFHKGDESHLGILWVLFIIASFVLIVHMLNMLIAIMGNIFKENSDVAEKVALKTRLRFVIDNWWLDALGEQKHKINYLVTAILCEEDDDEVEKIKEVQEDFHSLYQQNKVATDNIMA